MVGSYGIQIWQIYEDNIKVMNTKAHLYLILHIVRELVT